MRSLSCTGGDFVCPGAATGGQIGFGLRAGPREVVYGGGALEGEGLKRAA